LPRFVGGMVGYLGYEAVRHFEPKLAPLMAPSHLPDAIHLLSDTVVAFDHARRSLFVIAHVIDGDEGGRPTASWTRSKPCCARPLPVTAPKTARPSETRSNMSREDYEKMVRAAKEYISAGDIFQVVLSQRFSRKTTAEAFDIYRAVRRLNPSPYMFFFDFGDVDGAPLYLVGASPEMLVRLEDGQASLRPIAGTRPRGLDAKSR
jgi:anthranilate synthase component 1